MTIFFRRENREFDLEAVNGLQPQREGSSTDMLRQQQINGIRDQVIRDHLRANIAQQYKRLEDAGIFEMPKAKRRSK